MKPIGPHVAVLAKGDEEGSVDFPIFGKRRQGIPMALSSAVGIEVLASVLPVSVSTSKHCDKLRLEIRP